jgi:hypothetical protein
MNDDDYWNMSQPSYTKELYDLIKNYQMYKEYSRKDIDMAYSYSRGYYEDTQSKEVATAVLDAYADGVPFETLIKKNKAVRQYWYNIQSEKVKKAQANEREKIRLAKLAEKRAEEKAKREEVMSKLSREELEAFGFVKKGKR